MMTLNRVIDQALFGASLTVGQLFPILFFKMSSTASEFRVVNGGSAENQRTTDKTDVSTKLFKCSRGQFYLYSTVVQ